MKIVLRNGPKSVRQVQTIDSIRENCLVAVFATVFVCVPWFLLTWRYGFDMADEGYYWYGSQRILQGELPMRDFYSYDIGRYYWSAFFMRLLGDDGVFGARASAALFQVGGAFVGVYICLMSLRQRGVVRWIFAVLIASVLTVWVWPYYKVFDHFTSVLVVAALVLMLKSIRPSAWFFAGAVIGVAAIMGRNHGVYGMVAALLVISLLLIKAPSSRTVVGLFGYYLLGVLIGFSPTLIMMIAVDGFANAFIDSIVMLFQYGATNIGLPVPWPWEVKLGGMGVMLTAAKVSVGFGFVMLLAFPLLGVLAMTYRRFDLSNDSQKVFVAALAGAIPYAHYAFSRADEAHLALGIFPVLVGLLSLGGSMNGLRPLQVGIALLATSLLTIGSSQPYLSALLFKTKFVQADVGGQQLWLSRGTSKLLQFATEAISHQSTGSNNFLAVPNMTSLYAIYRTKMPIWEIYSLIPRNGKFEGREIERLELILPDLVLISDHALDGNPLFKYSQMRPRINEWITSGYQLTDTGENLGISDVRVYSLKKSLNKSAE